MPLFGQRSPIDSYKRDDFKGLLKSLTSKDENRRSTAASLLGNGHMLDRSVSDRKARDMLIHLAKHDDSEYVRMAAIGTLDSFPHDEVITQTVCEVALHDVDKTNRRRATDMLRSHSSALGTIIHLLEDDDSSVRRAAAGALRQVDDIGRIDALVDAFAHSDAEVRIEICQGFVPHSTRSYENVQAGGLRAIQGLANCVANDKDRRVRRAAVRALGSLSVTPRDHSEIIHAALRAASEDPDPEVAKEARKY